MDTRFVSSLLAVIEEGSLAAAARREGITASAVAQRISALEQDVRVTLLRRAGRVMQPTAECRNLLPQLQDMVRCEHEMRRTLSGAALAGRFRLGAVSTAMGDYAGHLLRYMRRAAPEVAVQLVPGTSEGLYADMEQNRLDAALLVEPPFNLPKSFVFHQLAQQDIGLLEPRKARGPAAAPQDVPYLIYSRDSWGGARCWEVLQTHVTRPAILAEMDALELTAQMVEEGSGQAVLPRWNGLSRYPNTQFTPFEGEFRSLGVLLHQRDSESALTQVVMNGLRGV